MYAHLPYFLYIAAMLCYLEDEEFFDEDFFKACGPPVNCLWCGSLFRYIDLLVLYAFSFDLRTGCDSETYHRHSSMWE
jgi:hypothetical protein